MSPGTHSRIPVKNKEGPTGLIQHVGRVVFFEGLLLSQKKELETSILVTGPWPLPRSCGVPEQARHLANGERRNQCGTRTPAALTCAAQGASAFHEGTSLERIWNQFANRSTQRSLSKPQGSTKGTRSTCVKLETQRGDRQRQQGD